MSYSTKPNKHDWSDRTLSLDALNRLTQPCPHGGGAGCSTCVAMCIRPGWFGLADASAALDAGHANSMMLDSWQLYSRAVFILGAAIPGYGGQHSPWFPRQACVFQSVDGLCDLHTSGFKPLECRAASCADSRTFTPEEDEARGSVHESIAKMWDTPEGVALVERWKALVNY